MVILLHSLFIGVYFLTLFFAQRQQRLLPKLSLHFLFLITSLALLAHSLPWVENIKIIDALRFNENSLPFTMYLNFDKPFIALIIFSVLGFGTNKFNIGRILKWSAYSLTSCSFALMSLALAANYVQFDPKLPPESAIWALNNLLLVCAAEEAFFRRYIQGGLTETLKKYRYGSWLAILAASVLFGLAHFKGGVAYILLSTVAGAFYGYAYFKSQRVEAAILTHFGLNTIHFFLFSYPALIPI